MASGPVVNSVLKLLTSQCFTLNNLLQRVSRTSVFKGKTSLKWTGW